MSGVDGLFWPEVPGFERHVVARAGAEAEWAAAAFGPDRVVPFTLAGPAPDTEALLRGSDIGERLAERGIGALLPTVRVRPGVRDWARAHRIRLLGTPPAQQARFEDKAWFDRRLRRLGLPVPPRVPVDWARGVASDWPIVVQDPDSLGGEGTWFADGPADLARLAGGGRRLVRRRVEGQPIGVTIFVAPGLVALSAARRQCYAPAVPGASLRFRGVQWLRTRDLPGRDLPRALSALGRWMYRERFFGFANVDLILSPRGEVWFLECNPRLSAATAQLLRHPELRGGALLGERYLDRPRDWPDRFAEIPMPDSTYGGATLDLPGPRIPRSGGWEGRRYRSHALEGPTVVVAQACPGDALDADQTVATVFSDAPLYDGAGALLPEGEAWLAGDWSDDVPR